MKKDFVSVFDDDTSIDEYQLDNLLDKNIKVKENEFPTILVDKEDDTSKYININNNSNINLNENNEKIEDNIINTIETNEISETENITNENDLSQAYTEEENNLYNDTENNISLTEEDLTDIEDVEEFNLEDAVFGNSDNDIYKNNSEKFNININDIENAGDMKEIDLMEEDNLKKENEILDYEDKEVIVPSVDNADYIDESDYINDINSDSEIVEMSGNELDLLTKDKDINEDKENILEALGNNMRKDNFLLEEKTIENEPTHIDDIDNINVIENIDKEKEEREKIDFYINKFKKLHDEYVKSIEENKETENNKINNEIEIKEENTENKNIENVESKKADYIEIEETNKIESPIIEESEEVKEELKTEESKINETETIENEPTDINDIDNAIENIDKEKEEQKKTDFYINKFKKLHDEYVKSIEENKETENNKINNEVETKEENTELETIEEANKIESPIIEESEEIKEESKTSETGTNKNATENENIEDKTNYYINKFKKLHDEYVKSIEENKETENNKINNEVETKEENTELETIEETNKIESPIIEEHEEIKEESKINETESPQNITEDIKVLDNVEITDKLSAEEEEMYKTYLGNDVDLIEEVEDIIPIENEETDNEEINMELEIAKNELKKKEETLSKLEIIGELSAEEENVFDDILRQNKNRYYEDDINNADIILKELNLDEIEEINENDFNILENFILGKEPEEGIELISINKNNENDLSKNNDNGEKTQIKSIEDFDSIDSEELLNVKETKMPEEKELKIDEQNIDLNVKVEDEFSLNKDDSILTNDKINQRGNGKEDFDGEITQLDLDLAVKLFETEDPKNNSEYGPKHDLLLSENDIVKFRKLFSYFKIIVEKLPQESLNDFSKTEFYDTYSSLFRKFGE